MQVKRACVDVPAWLVEQHSDVYAMEVFGDCCVPSIMPGEHVLVSSKAPVNPGGYICYGTPSNRLRMPLVGRVNAVYADVLSVGEHHNPVEVCDVLGVVVGVVDAEGVTRRL